MAENVVENSNAATLPISFVLRWTIGTLVGALFGILMAAAELELV